MSTLIFEKLSMQGYGLYVWAAYGVTFILLMGLLWWSQSNDAS